MEEISITIKDGSPVVNNSEFVVEYCGGVEIDLPEYALIFGKKVRIGQSIRLRYNANKNRWYTKLIK